MKRTKRIFSVLIGIVAVSLLIVANVWAFGVGSVDGVWSTIDTNGADCDGWASAGVPAFSATTPDIQSSGGNFTDENRVAYGDPAYATSGCPTNWADFQLQSGFGFNGINGPLSGLLMDVPFYLGSFSHYNNPINSASNRFDWVDLNLTVPIDCNNDGSTDTSFSFTPRFALDETSNNANPCKYKPGDPVNANGCADAVNITQPPTATFTCSGVDYTVNIYGFTSNADCSTIFDPNAVSTQYVTKEQATNSACLWAEIDRPVADAAVTKSCTNFGQANPYYTITVTNSGPGTALGAKIVDTLPGGVTYLSYTSTRTVGGVSSSQGTCSRSGQTVTCDLNAALPESTGDPTAKWEVKINVAYASGEDWTNSVVLTTTSSDTNLENNTATAACSSQVDVAVTKDDGDYEQPYPSLTNPKFDYAITVTNNGPHLASNVRVVDTLDDYTSFDETFTILINEVADIGLCSYVNDDAMPGGGTLTCNLGDMAAGASTTIKFGVKIETGVPTAGLLEIGDVCTSDTSIADICNTVNVNTDSNDTNSANNSTYEPKDVGVPTAVELAWFDVTKSGIRGITLGWETMNEKDILGFNVYRSGKPDAYNKLLTGEIISAQKVGELTGAVYTFKDKSVKSGKRYYYWLEVLNTDGTTELFGPVSGKIKR